jgi:hypothetical protein
MRVQFFVALAGVLSASACGYDIAASASGARDAGGHDALGGLASDAIALDARAPDTGAGEAGAPQDSDHDGISDADEDRFAHDYLPFLSLDPSDDCPRAGILYRLRPHPTLPGRLHMIVDVLLEHDCGALGHIGDDEVFGVTIDPSRPGPAGIVAVRAIAHQATACQSITDCGSCAGMSACRTATKDGQVYPVVFSSKNKHGMYVDEGACNGACFLSNWCTMAPMPPALPMVNAGEPSAPMTRDLTTGGFITPQNGWSEPELMHFDPWGNQNFGGAGNVTDDLTDDSFLSPGCAGS